MAQYEITNEPIAIDFEGTRDDDVLRTLQNAKNLLMCRMGEVPYDRWRGLNPALFDLPPDEFEEALLPELDRVMSWELDVEVVSATYELNSSGETIIHCVVQVTFEDGGDEDG